MGLYADYTTANRKLHRAYLRIENIWGSPRTGMNAFIGVYVSKDSDVVTESFSVSTVYQEGPHIFDQIYAEVGRLSFLSNIEHEVKTELNARTRDHIHADHVRMQDAKKDFDAAVDEARERAKEAAPKPKKPATKVKKSVATKA